MSTSQSAESRWPRGLSRVEAADYIGIGVSFFDQLRATGKLPEPFRLGKRVIYDRAELDRAFDSFKPSADDERNEAGDFELQ